MLLESVRLDGVVYLSACMQYVHVNSIMKF